MLSFLNKERGNFGFWSQFLCRDSLFHRWSKHFRTESLQLIWLCTWCSFVQWPYCIILMGERRIDIDSIPPSFERLITIFRTRDLSVRAREKGSFSFDEIKLCAAGCGNSERKPLNPLFTPYLAALSAENPLISDSVLSPFRSFTLLYFPRFKYFTSSKLRQRNRLTAFLKKIKNERETSNCKKFKNRYDVFADGSRVFNRNDVINSNCQSRPVTDRHFDSFS